MAQIAEPVGLAPLENLPNELIAQCLVHLRPDDIKSLRLISRRGNEVGSPHLIEYLRVYITPESLSRCEDISQHPAFQKSVRTVEVNVCFYDAIMAMDKLAFMRNCETELNQTVEMHEHFDYPYGAESESEDEDPAQVANIKKMYDVKSAWSQHISNQARIDPQPPASVLLLEKMYETYRQRYEAQEAVKLNRSHMKRIGISLLRMPAARSFIIHDRDCRSWGVVHDGKDDFMTDEFLESEGLCAEKWKKNFSSQKGPPPGEMLLQLFETLSEHGIRPISFKVQVTPPPDLTVLHSSAETQRHIRIALQHAQHLRFDMSSWARRDSLAEDNRRPNNEMIHLANLTNTFFDTPTLQSLDLKFGGYPAFYEVPQVCFMELLPSRTWEHLQLVQLHHVPLHQRELAAFVERQQDTIIRLEAEGLHLLSGTWVDSIEVLRQLKKLKHLSFKYPHGAEFGFRGRYYRQYPTKAVEDYILYGGETNPLRGMVWDT